MALVDLLKIPSKSTSAMHPMGWITKVMGIKIFFGGVIIWARSCLTSDGERLFLFACFWPMQLFLWSVVLEKAEGLGFVGSMRGKLRLRLT